MEIDEKGTEAAATTVFGLMDMCGSERSPPLERVRFIGDRPILFVIADERNNQIVFIGRIRNPKRLRKNVVETKRKKNQNLGMERDPQWTKERKWTRTSGILGQIQIKNPLQSMGISRKKRKK